MKLKMKLLALLLVVAIALSSCSSTIDSILQMIPGLGTTASTTTTEPTPTTTTKPLPDHFVLPEDDFDRAQYSTSRKELLEMYTLTKEEVDAAMANLDTMVEVSKTAATVDEIDAIYDEFETAFYHIAQQMTIASLIYYCNMSDETAKERHLNTTEMFYDLQDKYNQSCRTMYLESPHSAELFADWSEEEIQSLLEYDPTIVEVKKRVEELQTEFDNLPDDIYFDDRSVEIYKQVVINNNKIAELNGYDNYYTYASKNVYGRDYTTEDLALFRQYIVDYIVPEFDGVYKDFEAWRDLSSSRQERFKDFVNGSFDAGSKNYLALYLNSLEGDMGEGMRHVFENKNCVFSNNSNSHPTAFQTYLYEDEKPFCLFGSDGQSANTMVHEIGHYYAALTNNDINNYDLCETHSQGNEFLFIKFCEDELSSAIYDCVRAYNLVNACFIIIIATIVDEFEQTVYSLDDETIAAMTSEDFDAIIESICEPYGGLSWVSSNITDPLNYWRRVAVSNPVYYISYATSAVASLEIFALVEEDKDAAYEAYSKLIIGVTEEDGFLGALAKAGISTPFEESTYQSIAKTLKK